MNTFSAFRSVATELLYPNLRCNGRVLPRFGLKFVGPSRLFHRHFHLSRPCKGWVKNEQPVKTRNNVEDKKLREKKLREIGLNDRNIPYERVFVRTPQGLSSSRLLVDVIAEAESLNGRDNGEASEKKILKHYCVRLVAHDTGPIVAIIDAKEEYRKQKQVQERAKNNAAQQVRKEVQLTWASSEADVGTKLEKIEEDLKKGFKVDLVMMPKKNVRPPRHEDMQQRVDDLVTHFSQIAKEWRARDYTRTTAVIYFQGTSSTAAVVEGGKKPKRLLLKEQKKQKEEERTRKKQELEARSGGDVWNDYNLPIPLH